MAALEPVGKAWQEQTPKLEARWAAKAMEGRIEQVRDVCNAEFRAVVNTLNYDPKTRPESKPTSLPDDQIDCLMQLISPPACTACPLYIKNSNAHWCSWKHAGSASARAGAGWRWKT